jgi:hypothetical protein
LIEQLSGVLFTVLTYIYAPFRCSLVDPGTPLARDDAIKEAIFSKPRE